MCGAHGPPFVKGFFNSQTLKPIKMQKKLNVNKIVRISYVISSRSGNLLIVIGFLYF